MNPKTRTDLLLFLVREVEQIVLLASVAVFSFSGNSFFGLVALAAASAIMCGKERVTIIGWKCFGFLIATSLVLHFLIRFSIVTEPYSLLF